MSKIKSWDKKYNIDCFGNGNPREINHIWPLSLGGSNTKKNKQFLSHYSNREKANKTKGVINGIRFSIIKQTDENGFIYGKMSIVIDDVWYEVEKIL